MTRLRVLVTGAEERQGLSVIRGLARAGMDVIACGSQPDSVGFYSRFPVARHLYGSPFEHPTACRDDLLWIIRRTRPDLVMPTVESTLVVLHAARDEVAHWSTLAAAPPNALEYALDKTQTLRLSERLGVPVPRSICGDTVDTVLAQAVDLRFPVAIKPRGPRLHASTAHRVGFKVSYADSFEALHTLLTTLGPDVRSVLVQEYIPGVGRCVAAVCANGEPVALFAYERLRELPHTGGVSVVRRSERLDPRLEQHVTALLGAVAWHGVAMVEFRYDRRLDRFTLMEINGRFQASTALSLDAGLNLPALAANVHLDRPVTAPAPYRPGVTERWLRGDLLALYHAATVGRGGPRLGGAAPAAPPLWRMAGRFLLDFRPRTHYDEFHWSDPLPALLEAVAILRLVTTWVMSPVRRLGRYVLSPLVSSEDASSAAANSPTHDSMRA